MCHENGELYFPCREYGTEFVICHSVCFTACVLWKVRLREKREEVLMRLCWACLRVFVSRIWGCRQTGAPQTRCRLGAMLNNPAQTGRGLHHSCFILSTYPPLLSPHPPVPCQYRQQYKLWRDFSGNRKQFTSSLFCVVPPPAASCHGSLLFSQEISQTSPEVDLVHSKMSACQGVLRLLHSFAAQRLSLALRLPSSPSDPCNCAVFFLCFI